MGFSITKGMVSAAIASSAFVLALPAKAFVVIDNTNNGTVSTDSGWTLSSGQYVGISFGTGPDSGGYRITEFLINMLSPSSSDQYVASLYSSVLPSGTLLATDIFSPLIPSSGWSYTSLDAGLIPNIISVLLNPSSTYSLAIAPYSPFAQSAWGFRNEPVGTTYTVTNGFSVSGSYASSNQGTSWGNLYYDPLYQLNVVPAPLPIIGVATFIGYSRKLRKRIQHSPARGPRQPDTATLGASV
jgi:hypothetical protein